MSPMTFLFVVVIILTFGAVLNLITGFSELVVSREVKVFEFVVWTGMAIWGWLIYFG